MTKNLRVALALANLIAFAATFAVNGLANALPINGKTTGTLSDQYPNYFVPAGLTFAIWGLIYLLLAIWAVWQLVGAFRDGTPAAASLAAIGPWFIVASAANIAWIFAWHYEKVGLSLVLMIGLLTSLVVVYLRSREGSGSFEGVGRLVAHVPFSVYLGWITVATVANVTALLVDRGWSGGFLSETAWAAIMVLVAAAVTLAVLWSRGDIFYALVILWALAGIVIKRTSLDPAVSRVVILAGWIGIGLVGAAVLERILRGRVYIGGLR